jgi:hypothetical protein
MSIKEKDIKHEQGDFWVLDTGKGYAVMKTGTTHSTSDSEYAHSADGLSIAIARCNYLARRAMKKMRTEVYRAYSCGECYRMKHQWSFCHGEEVMPGYFDIETGKFICEIDELDPETMEEVEP